MASALVLFGDRGACPDDDQTDGVSLPALPAGRSPLDVTGWMMLAGFGGLAAARRRSGR